MVQLPEIMPTISNSNFKNLFFRKEYPASLGILPSLIFLLKSLKHKGERAI